MSDGSSDCQNRGFRLRLFWSRTFALMRSQPWPSVSVLLGLLFLTLSIVGAVHAYSPVPFWDMWDGYIGFFTHVSKDPSLWWAQHNEHRIVLARILFWLDLRYFGGESTMLIVVNYLLATLGFGMLAWCSRQITELSKSTQVLLAGWLLALAFAWTQSNNLSWGFQSQFFLAQVLPLAALLLLHASSLRQDRWRTPLFAAAIVTAVLSAGSMANGALAAMLVAVTCVIGRQSFLRILVALGAGVAVLALYFHGYHAPGGHGSLVSSIKEHPFGTLAYALTYIGSPFAFLTADPSRSLWAALAAGTVIACAATYLVVMELLRRNRGGVDQRLALAMFLVYLGAAALAVAGSRLIFGLENAVSSRYTTPALLILACVVVLGIQSLVRGKGRRAEHLAPLLLLVPLSLLPQQLRALRYGEYEGFERFMAALALELRIKDDEQIIWTFPNSAWALEIARPASERDISIFANPVIHDAINTIGANYPVSDGVAGCAGGAVSTLVAIDDTSLRVKGGMMAKDLPRDISPLYVLDRDRRIIGRALLANPGWDKGAGLMAAPFKGYVLMPEAPMPWSILSPAASCSVAITKPVDPE